LLWPPLSVGGAGVGGGEPPAAPHSPGAGQAATIVAQAWHPQKHHFVVGAPSLLAIEAWTSADYTPTLPAETCTVWFGFMAVFEFGACVWVWVVFVWVLWVCACWANKLPGAADFSPFVGGYVQRGSPVRLADHASPGCCRADVWMVSRRQRGQRGVRAAARVVAATRRAVIPSG
jgi:hypothetical protein